MAHTCRSDRALARAHDQADRRYRQPVLIHRIREGQGVAQSAATSSEPLRTFSTLKSEDNLWTGIGRSRSGCGAAIVGDPDQVLAKLDAYREVA